MKIKRKLTLGQALDEVAKVAQAIKASGNAVVDGKEYRLEDEVELEIEFEAGEKKAELEFEIKWKQHESLMDQAKKIVSG